jgi:thiol:disulfide interchange protein DsbD
VTALGACGSESQTDESPHSASEAEPTAPAVDVVPTAPVVWTTVGSVEDLQGRLARAARDGRPVVVSVRAAWCMYCRSTDRLVAEDAEVRALFQRVVALRVDVTADPRKDLRVALALPPMQPYLAFFGTTGKRLPRLDIDGLANRARLLDALRQVGASGG